MASDNCVHPNIGDETFREMVRNEFSRHVSVGWRIRRRSLRIPPNHHIATHTHYHTYAFLRTPNHYLTWQPTPAKPLSANASSKSPSSPTSRSLIGKKKKYQPKTRSLQEHFGFCQDGSCEKAAKGSSKRMSAGVTPQHKVGYIFLSKLNDADKIVLRRFFGAVHFGSPRKDVSARFINRLGRVSRLPHAVFILQRPPMPWIAST